MKKRNTGLLISMSKRLIGLLETSEQIFWRDRPWTHTTCTQSEIEYMNGLQKTEQDNAAEIIGLCEEICSIPV